MGLFSSKPQTIRWVEMPGTSIYQKGHYIRLKRTLRVDNQRRVIDSKLPPLANIPQGAVGYCYGATPGLVRVAFGSDFKAYPYDPCDARCRYVANFTWRDVGALEISEEEF